MDTHIHGGLTILILTAEESEAWRNEAPCKGLFS
jgi:hypothetical protein